MVLMWTDMLIDGLPSELREDLARLDDVIYSPGYDPAARWANLLAAARVTGDDRSCEALLASIPQGQAAGYARTHVTLVAGVFNRLADAVRGAAEQGHPDAQWLQELTAAFTGRQGEHHGLEM